ncbi:hypothetical protein SB725_25650 [Pseudomonas sp. SIMBA_041]|uniref:hypothetical protein n=1 Tax=Pseudomonas sp. SIMBA_041 TaxID=3085782 RepID=UPI003979B2B7
MLNKNPFPSGLSTWDDQDAATSLDDKAFTAPPALTNAELVHLRVRVIALENLVIALLADGSEHQLSMTDLRGWLRIISVGGRRSIRLDLHQAQATSWKNRPPFKAVHQVR